MEKDEFDKSLRNVYDVHNDAAMEVIPFSEMLKNEPDKAINLISKKYKELLDQAYTDKKGNNNRSYIEAIAGGPCETIPWAVYNAVGEVYPNFSREQKDKTISQILSILDRRNYVEVNCTHTPGIREPLLLSDICVARPLYWPGLDDEEKLFKNTKNFEEIENLFDEKGNFRKDKVNSDFLVAYGILRSDGSNFGKELIDYLNIKNSNFLERTIKGITALRFFNAKNNEDLVKRKERLEELLPESTHEMIQEFMLEKDWVDYTKFERN